MGTAYNVILGIAVLVAASFVLLVLVTSKGDAMSSGGGAIRTTYKGKASIDEQISRMTLYLGGGFLALMILLDILNHKMAK